MQRDDKILAQVINTGVGVRSATDDICDLCEQGRRPLGRHCVDLVRPDACVL